jgi:hypothetical protein
MPYQAHVENRVGGVVYVGDFGGVGGAAAGIGWAAEAKVRAQDRQPSAAFRQETVVGAEARRLAGGYVDAAG